MKRSIQKWGHSLALRIPKALAEHLQVEEGAEVYLTAEADTLVIRPAAKRADLKDLLEGITAENCHGKTSTGDSVGREVW